MCLYIYIYIYTHTHTHTHIHTHTHTMVYSVYCQHYHSIYMYLQRLQRLKSQNRQCESTFSIQVTDININCVYRQIQSFMQLRMSRLLFVQRNVAKNEDVMVSVMNRLQQRATYSSAADGREQRRKSMQRRNLTSRLVRESQYSNKLSENFSAYHG